MASRAVIRAIDQDWENDYYRFTLGYWQNFHATVSFTHASGDVNLQLLNNTGSVIASSTGVWNSETVEVVCRARSPQFLIL